MNFVALKMLTGDQNTATEILNCHKWQVKSQITLYLKTEEWVSG